MSIPQLQRAQILEQYNTAETIRSTTETIRSTVRTVEKLILLLGINQNVKAKRVKILHLEKL